MCVGWRCRGRPRCHGRPPLILCMRSPPGTPCGAPPRGTNCCPSPLPRACQRWGVVLCFVVVFSSPPLPPLRAHLLPALYTWPAKLCRFPLRRLLCYVGARFPAWCAGERWWGGGLGEGRGAAPASASSSPPPPPTPHSLPLSGAAHPLPTHPRHGEWRWRCAASPSNQTRGGTEEGCVHLGSHVREAADHEGWEPPHAFCRVASAGAAPALWLPGSPGVMARAWPRLAAGARARPRAAARDGGRGRRVCGGGQADRGLPLRPL